jgi:hypothetical protein
MIFGKDRPPLFFNGRERLALDRPHVLTGPWHSDDGPLHRRIPEGPRPSIMPQETPHVGGTTFPAAATLSVVLVRVTHLPLKIAHCAYISSKRVR